MAEYQNIFTRVQVHGANRTRACRSRAGTGRAWASRVSTYWLGNIGDAQIGPIYLGWLGLASLLCGFIAIEIIGLNMWASVNWDPIQFVRQLPWLALEPPSPEYGLRMPPLNEGGWWLMAGFFLTTSILLWWVRMYRRARALRHGHACGLGLRRRDLAVPRARLHPPAADGQLERGGAVRHLPAPRLDRGVLDPLRQPVLQPVPRAVDRLPVRIGAAVRHARRHGPCRPRRYGGDREVEQIARPRHGLASAMALFWRWTMGFNATIESIHRWAWWFAVLCPLVGGIGILLTGTVVDNWYLWAVKHGVAPMYPVVFDPVSVDPATLPGAPQ